MKNFILFYFILCCVSLYSQQINKNYSYDSLKRLVQTNYGNTTITYQYDKLGNRINRQLITNNTITQDWSITNPIAATPNTVQEGANINIMATFQNNGINNGNATIWGYWSSDNTLDIGDNHFVTLNTGNVNGGNSVSQTHPITLPSSLANGTGYIIFFIDGPNAIAETNENNNTATVAITVDNNVPLNVPIVNFSSDATAICSGGSIQFTDQSSNNPNLWLWQFPGGTPTTSTAQNPSVTYNTPGTYSVSSEVSNSDGSSILTKTGFIEVIDNNLTAYINVADDVCGNNSGSATAVVTNGVAPYTYSWSDGQTGAIATGLTAGSYDVTITDNCGGTYTETFSITNNVGNSTSSTGNYDWIWARGFINSTAGSGHDVYARNGHIYLVGTSANDVELAGYTIPAGVGDIFIAKLNSIGEVIWGKRYGGSNQEVAEGIYVDANEQIYITGYFVTTTSLGGVNLTNTAQDAPFVAKLDGDGTVLWAKNATVSTSIVGHQKSSGLDVTTDNSGNVYICGKTFGTATFATGQTITSPSGEYDGFVAKYNSSGTFQWLSEIGGTAYEEVNKVIVLNDGNIGIAGSFDKQAIFKGGTTLNSLSNKGFSYKNLIFFKKAMHWSKWSA